MTRDEHIAAAEQWLARAEWFWGMHGEHPPEAAACASIAAAHFAGAAVAPVVVTMRHPSGPAGQGHDGQETTR